MISIFLAMFLALFPTQEMAKRLQEKYNPPRKDYIIFIDYSKSISEERLYVMRVSDGKIMLKNTVAHAYNSGREYATSFSNTVGTKKSCIGAFVTLDSYTGRWGYSMRIRGLDTGVNDNAQARAIIFHSNIVQKTTWSEGCFATPHLFNKILIDLTKGGCLVYVYQ